MLSIQIEISYRNYLSQKTRSVWGECVMQTCLFQSSWMFSVALWASNGSNIRIVQPIDNNCVQFLSYPTCNTVGEFYTNLCIFREELGKIKPVFWCWEPHTWYVNFDCMWLYHIIIGCLYVSITIITYGETNIIW